MHTNILPAPAKRAKCATNKKNLNSTPSQNPSKPYDPELRARLLAEAVLKPVQSFVQFDSFGPELFISLTDELRRSGCIRLQVPVGTSKAVVLGALKQFKQSVERGELPLGDAQPHTGLLDEFLKGTAPLVLKLAANPIEEAAAADIPF